MPETAKTVMTSKVISIRPDDLVPAAAAVLATHNISAAPVVDAAGTLVGMLSEGDLIRPFGAKNQVHRAWWLDMLAEGGELAPAFLDYIRLDLHKAADLMVRPVITVTEDTTITDIADLLAEHHIKRVPVLRDGRVVGIVSRADLVRVLAKSPEQLLA
ncbi:MAG: CBS domain-containing protein [Acidiphilium sp.]|nr:CBS domain-containing protein [Acidiphilium sp.]MDD4934485.1 CBS domain-containing protein [Acidiphilium sp.]